MLLGNDDEKFSFAIDPEIILPTVSHHVASESVQGDVIFTVSIKLPAGFSTTINATPVTGPGATDARQVDVGARWRPWPNLQFDAGCNFGVSRAATDYRPFVGIVTRF